ncbi:MAG: methyltransferase domain-containing protein [Sphingobacteriales bacterium]|nr:MAG: methyltransferase domain-containing protein [Sphingobacteriales bacterium]
MVDLSVRSILPEKMDAPGVPAHETQQALRELEVVNELLGGYNVILQALEKMDWPDREVIIMDLGCGGGDILRSIANWAQKKNRNVKLIGIDWNPVMTAYASGKSKQYSSISFKTMSVFDDALLNEKADITTSSLFCHHFDKVELVGLVSRMYRLADMAVIINDLHRHWIAYHSIKWITAAFSQTYLVKYDAPLSVARSFTRQDWRETLSEAGIANYSLSWKWAWRWELIIKK